MARRPKTLGGMVQRDDESDADWGRRCQAWINGEDIPMVVSSLEGWTGSPPFHLDVPERKQT